MFCVAGKGKSDVLCLEARCHVCAVYGTDREQKDAGDGWDRLLTLGSRRDEVQLLGRLPPVQSFGIRNHLRVPVVPACWLFEAEGLGCCAHVHSPSIMPCFPVPGERGTQMLLLKTKRKLIKRLKVEQPICT